MANNQRKLSTLVIDNKEYCWNYQKAKNVLDEYSRKERKYKSNVFEELGELLHVSSDGVKKWFTRGNGPGNADYVLEMAKYFGVSYLSLLKEKKTMEELLEKAIHNQDELAPDMINSMLNIIGLLNRLAADTNKGYMSFSKYVELVKQDENFEFDGILYVDELGDNYGKIIADKCVDSKHEDVGSTYDQMLDIWAYDEYILRVNDYDEEDIFIDFTGDGLNIVIENGIWYSVM